MRHDKIRNFMTGHMKSILLLLLSVCAAAPAVMAESEAQRYKKIISDLKKRGYTRADVERDFRNLKSSNRYRGGNDRVDRALNQAVRNAELDNCAKILKYWPEESPSGEGNGYSAQSPNAINGAWVSQTLNDLAGITNDAVKNRSAENSVDAAISGMKGDMNCEIMPSAQTSEFAGHAPVESDELLSMFEGGGRPQGDNKAGNPVEEILTDDFMGAVNDRKKKKKRIKTNTLVNDQPISAYQSEVDYWQREMGKYPEGSDDWYWAHANLEEAQMRLRGLKERLSNEVKIDADLSWRQDKAVDGAYRYAKPVSPHKTKVNGTMVNMPPLQKAFREHIPKSPAKPKQPVPNPPKGQIDTFFKQLNSDF